MTAGYRIGIDLGGTKTEGALLGEDPIRPLRRVRIATPKDRGYDAILEAVGGLIGQLLREAGGEAEIGVGIPGTISTTHGRVKNANTTCLIGHPLGRDLEQSRTTRTASPWRRRCTGRDGERDASSA
jgi:fructokinase